MYSYILGEVVIIITYTHKLYLSSLLGAGCFTRQNFRVRILKNWTERRHSLYNIEVLIETEVNENGGLFFFPLHF